MHHYFANTHCVDFSCNREELGDGKTWKLDARCQDPVLCLVPCFVIRSCNCDKHGGAESKSQSPSKAIIKTLLLSCVHKQDQLAFGLGKDIFQIPIKSQSLDSSHTCERFLEHFLSYKVFSG